MKHTPAAVSGVHFRGLRDRRVVYDLKINGVNGRYVGTVIDSQGVMLELAQGPDDEDHYWISRTDLVTVLPNRDNELDVERWLGAE